MEHVNGWCFRGIYNGLWENDLHVSARSSNKANRKLKSKVHWKKESFEYLRLFRQNFNCKFTNKRDVLN